MDGKWLAIMTIGVMIAASLMYWAEGQRTPAHVCAEQKTMTPFCEGLLKDLAARIESANRK